MKLEDFVRNLRNIDDGHDLDFEMLSGIYERIKSSEFRHYLLICRLHKGPVVSVAGPNFVKFLKDLAEEQKFAVTYVEMDEPVEGGG